jgi:hypothetical protein
VVWYSSDGSSSSSSDGSMISSDGSGSDGSSSSGSDGSMISNDGSSSDGIEEVLVLMMVICYIVDISVIPK